MNIDAYSFGSITIDGKTYRSDLIIYPDKIDQKWWRKSGHLLQMVDLRQITGYKPEILIIGTGASELMRIDPEVENSSPATSTIISVARNCAPTARGIAKITITSKDLCKIFLNPSL